MMQNYNYKYYEPLEQMIAVRHQYMSKIIKNITHLNIYEYLKNKKILDIGCGTGEFLKNYHELNNQCLGIDIQQNFKFENKIGFTLKNTDLKNFIKNNKKKFDIIFIFEFLNFSLALLIDISEISIPVIFFGLKLITFSIVGPIPQP